MVKRTLLISFLCFFAYSNYAYAAPTLTDSTNYRIELLATDIGAVDGLTFNSSGDLYFTDYQNWRVLKITAPSQPGTHSYEVVVATGISYPVDLTFNQEGRLFVTSDTNNVVEVLPNGSTPIYSTGYSYPSGITSYGNTLFVSNSGNGTISKIDSLGNSSLFISGLSSPYGPYHASIDVLGNLYFVDHGTGRLYSSDQSGNITYLNNSVSPFGGTFTAVGPNGDIFISDCNAGAVYKIDKSGNKTLFASGFIGKSTPPVIGPTGIAFDSNGNMYIADGSNIWKITASNYVLHIVSKGSGSGTINYSTDISGNECIGDCSQSFPDGTVITLNANPTQDSLFAGWLGCESLTAKQCTLTMSSDTQVVAYFSKRLNPGEIGFEPTQNFMTTERDQHATVLLPDGKVLITGGRHWLGVADGTPVNAAEIYDPVSQTFSPALGSMNIARSGHRAILLSNGKILIVGGSTTSELYDPNTGLFSVSGSVMATIPYREAIVQLKNGKVLLVGGSDYFVPSTSVDIYDPVTDTISSAPNSMNIARTYPDATLLSDGRVLITGGTALATTGSRNSNILKSAEIYDPEQGTITLLSSTMTVPRYFHRATLLNDGTVLITGGWSKDQNGIDNINTDIAEIFNPSNNNFEPISNKLTSARGTHTSTRLPDGKVLLAGGAGTDYMVNNIAGETADIYDPSSKSFTSAQMSFTRSIHTATLLPNHTVFICGGFFYVANGYNTNSAEIYYPAYSGYLITATAGSHGSINPSGILNANAGSNASFTITPNAGYMVYSVLVDGVQKGGITSYTFQNVKTDHTIDAYFKPITYTITATADANGAISTPGVNTVNPGSSMTFTITPTAGYHVADLLVDGVSQGALSSYTFTNVTANRTISAIFAENAWIIINASTGPNGTISPSGNGSVLGGTNQKFTITPAAGYRVANVVVDGVSKGALTSYTFYSVQATHIISASFVLDVYSITATADAHGSITPSGTLMVNSRDSANFTITPDTGYQVQSVIVDGANRGTMTSYTFNNVMADHTINTYFKPITYTVAATAGSGGKISPPGTSTFNVAASQIYSITPTAGYHVADVTVDGASQGAVTSYTFTDIRANHTISATFAANNGYTITASASGNGAISPSGSVPVLAGANQKFTFTPAAGCRISDVTVDGASVGVRTSYTFYSVQAVHTITVTFVLDVYTITAAADVNGRISPAGTIKVNKNGSQTFTITPNAGYQVSNVIVNGSAKGVITSYTFMNVTANYTINAYFKPLPIKLMGGSVQGVQLSLSNVVTTFAGSAGLGGSADGTGSAARFNYPYGLTADGINLYVADTGSSTIRKIVISTGEVTTLAGLAGIEGSTDGIGSSARFGEPWGLTTDGTNLYVADTLNQSIRKVVISTGEVTTLAGSAIGPGCSNGIGSAARFYNPGSLTTDGTSVYVMDMCANLRKIAISTGEVTTLAGSSSHGYADGIGTAASFSGGSVTTDGTNIYVSENENNTIRKVVISTAEVTTLAGSAGVAGSTDGIGSAARFNGPWNITTDGTNLYVSDMLNQTVRKIVISTGAVTTLAGSVGIVGSSDGTGPTALFNYPWSITTDGHSLYLTDGHNHTVRKIQ